MAAVSARPFADGEPSEREIALAAVDSAGSTA
jgi:hypothetical protein